MPIGCVQDAKSIIRFVNQIGHSVIFIESATLVGALPNLVWLMEGTLGGEEVAGLLSGELLYH